MPTSLLRRPQPCRSWALALQKMPVTLDCGRRSFQVLDEEYNMLSARNCGRTNPKRIYTKSEAS
eukprot:5274841-Amphidinium_carterae.1